MSAKQDRNGVRTASDVERRHKLALIETTAKDVEELKDEIVVDDHLSTTSIHPVQNKVITQNLNSKVTKETGKGLSSNDFTNEYVEKVNNSFGESHSHDNKSILDGITANTSYNLSDYKVSGLTILRSNCVKSNGRVVINFVGTISMDANTTTTIFNLPEELCPSETRDFVLFGQSSNTNGYIGYGYLTNSGTIQVRFEQAITSYIRFSFVYDI